MTAADACLEIGVDPARGLTSEEAALRLTQHGANSLLKEERKPWWRVFLRQFTSPLIYVLFAAAVLAFALGKHEDAGVILLVVIVNSIIGAFQEGRAERSMDSLRRLSSLQMRVLRNGEARMIEARDLVPGDVMVLAAGDAVGADARLLETAALEAAEATLTGESLPVVKHTEPLPEETLLADRRNMVFSETHITAGHGKALVVATGRAAEVGKIATITTAAEEPKTPLEMRMDQFGRQLVLAAVGLFALVMVAGMLRRMPLTEILIVA